MEPGIVEANCLASQTFPLTPPDENESVVPAVYETPFSVRESGFWLLESDSCCNLELLSRYQQFSIRTGTKSTNSSVSILECARDVANDSVKCRHRDKTSLAINVFQNETRKNAVLDTMNLGLNHRPILRKINIYNIMDWPHPDTQGYNHLYSAALEASSCYADCQAIFRDAPFSFVLYFCRCLWQRSSRFASWAKRT